VSFETSLDSKQPKLELKLVLALSETKSLFRLFRFYTETESFDLSIEPKQTKDQPNQFDREPVLQFFTENLGFFRFFSFFFVFFSFFRFFSVCFETVCFGCFASTPKQRVSRFEFLVSQNKRETDLVSVCFGSNRNLFLFVSRTPYTRLLTLPDIYLCILFILRFYTDIVKTGETA
jgi:hypothetical protein